MRHPLLLAPALLGWLGGLVLACYPILFSGFARVPGDLGDSRLIHYILEHDYRWMTGAPGHRNFWDPAFFYPTPNAAAFSDLLLSAAPFYACWRLLGFAPDTAYQLWVMTVVSLNYAAMYLFLARCLRLPGLPAAAGAFLFAFASPRLVQMCHLQLQLHFYTALCAYALYRLFEGAAPPAPPRTSRLPGPAWIAVAAVCTAGQLYASFYLGWYLGLGLAVVGAWALLFPSARARLRAVLTAYPASLAAGALLLALLLLPLASHYLEAARLSPRYEYVEIARRLPAPQSWLYRGTNGWAQMLSGQAEPRTNADGERALGIGWVTTTLVLLGFVRGRQRTLVRLLVLAAATFVLCTTVCFYEGVLYSFYGSLFRVIPAADAIRAPSRVGLLLLLPAAVGLACFFSTGDGGKTGDGRPKTEEKPGPVSFFRLPSSAFRLACCLLFPPLLAVCVFEQGQLIPTFDKHESRARVAQVVRRIPPGARAFFVSRLLSAESDIPLCTTHLDGMWAQLESGVPTANGYSGATPPGWRDLEFNQAHLPDKIWRLGPALDRWCATRGLPREQVAWIRLGDPPPASGLRIADRGLRIAEGGSLSSNPQSEESAIRNPQSARGGPPPLPRDTLPDRLPLDAIPAGLPRDRPVPKDNPLTEAKVRLGRRLFFDPILSADGTVSCATCHQPGHGFASPLPRAVGAGGRRGPRNSPSLLNRAYGRAFFWDGREATLEAQALRPIASPLEMGSSVADAVRRLREHQEYPARFRAAFPDGVTAANLARALASFERVLLTGDTRVDQFRAGRVQALTDRERHGLWLFESRGRCWRCHSGPNFTDEAYHNTGVRWGQAPADPGRHAVTGQEADRGRFKTPTLRGLRSTAPYMHDGSMATLDEVVAFYNRGGGPNPHLDPAIVPLGLSKEDLQDLVAFLAALSEGRD